MVFDFNATKDKLRLSSKNSVIAGNANTYTCTFSFDESYEGLVPFAVFDTGSEQFVSEIIDNKCLFASDGITSGVVKVGVFATTAGEENFKRLSTNYVEINVVTGAYSVLAIPATPDIWETYLTEIKKLKDETTEIKNEACLAAKTAADDTVPIIYEYIDKAVLSQRVDIVNDVLSALPDGDEVSY